MKSVGKARPGLSSRGRKGIWGPWGCGDVLGCETNEFCGTSATSGEIVKLTKIVNNSKNVDLVHYTYLVKLLNLVKS